ncbi:MAG: SPOR domain-containing protein [Piscinibacter sp.]|nr:SPOR domain-containing protein [Piscinibacter sp.]
MLRLLALLLLAANLLFFAWSQGWLADLTGLRPHPEREPQRLARQVRPETIVVLPPPPTPPAPRSPSGTASAVVAAAAEPPVCLEAGPFATGASISAMATLRAVQPPLPPGSWVEVTIERPGAWLVVLAKPANRDALAKRDEELKRARVAYEVLTTPEEFAGSLSLGRFNDREAADRALAQFGQRGIRPARVVELQAASTIHLLRADQADKALAAQLKALKSDTLGRGFVPCGS